MLANLVFLVTALATAQAGHAPTPDPRLGGLTLEEALNMPREDLRGRVLSAAGQGDLLVELTLTGYGMSATFLSPARGAAPGLCQAKRRYLRWETNAPRPDADEYLPGALPPRSARAPLGVMHQYTQPVFHAAEGRRRWWPLRRSGRGCARLPAGAAFFDAEGTSAALRAIAILASLQQRIAVNPISVEANCFQVPDCLDQIRALRINQISAVVTCWDPGLPPDRACVRFQVAGRSSPGSAEWIQLDVETATDSSTEARRLSWANMIAHFD